MPTVNKHTEYNRQILTESLNSFCTAMAEDVLAKFETDSAMSLDWGRVAHMHFLAQLLLIQKKLSKPSYDLKTIQQEIENAASAYILELQRLSLIYEQHRPSGIEHKAHLAKVSFAVGTVLLEIEKKIPAPSTSHSNNSFVSFLKNFQQRLFGMSQKQRKLIFTIKKSTETVQKKTQQRNRSNKPSSGRTAHP